MLQSLEDYFQRVRNHDEYSQTFVTLATAVGFAWIIIYAIRMLYALLRALYLFVLARMIKIDFRKRYGQWAVISGATDGIGYEMAKELARRGHSLILIGRNREKLNNVREVIKGLMKPSEEIMTIRIDLARASVRDYERVRDEIDPARREIGMLINNAGIFPTEIKRYLRHDPDYIREQVDVNVNSALMLTRFIMPSMTDRGTGVVINIASTVGRISAPYLCAYSATKAFICSFSETLRYEYKDHRVEVLNLIPGMVKTKMISTWTRPSCYNIGAPTPESYARSALACVGRSTGETTGYWWHGIQHNIGAFICWLGLHNLIYASSVKSIARVSSNKISPVPKRKGTTKAAAAARSGADRGASKV